MPALVEIEGIGEHYADKLAQARIGSVQTLLKHGATRAGRKAIAATSGIDMTRLLAFVNRADLFRIRGIGEEYSDLLEASGVDSVPELAQRNASHLRHKMVEVNEKRNLVRRVPGLPEIRRWIKQSKKLPKVVKH